MLKLLFAIQVVAAGFALPDPHLLHGLWLKHLLKHRPITAGIREQDRHN
jgi:hypothetical protein